MGKRIKENKIQVWLWMAALFWIFCRIPSAHSMAAVKHLTMSGVEKKLTAASTRKVQFRYGKIYSTNNKWWKRAKTISSGAKTMVFSRRGNATFRFVNTKGKKRLFSVRIKKKRYTVKANQALTQKNACLYLVPGAKTNHVLSVPEGSCLYGTRVTASEKGDGAGQQWMLEPAKNARFRLKNVNSGLYMAALKEGNSTHFRLEQRSLNREDRAFLFEAVHASAKYVYIRNVSSGKWMYAKSGTVLCRERGNTAEWRFRLTETAPVSSDIQASGYTSPTSLLMGTAFTLKGTVRSRYAMVSLTAMVLSAADNKVIQQKTAAPDQCRYDLIEVDSAIKFGDLPVGNYIYRVVAKDKKGVVKTVIDRRFSVYLPGASGAKTLTYNPALIQAIGHQSEGTDMEKKACASFALAYCQAVLYGTSPAPQTYWVSDGNVDCVWSRGGYRTNTYGSEAALLQAAYLQLLSGKPCILHVYSQASSQHWLTLVGYRDAASPSGLSGKNFIAIDPWDGAVITVSDKYKIKNTYRLGVRA